MEDLVMTQEQSPQCRPDTLPGSILTITIISRVTKGFSSTLDSLAINSITDNKATKANSNMDRIITADSNRQIMLQNLYQTLNMELREVLEIQWWEVSIQTEAVSIIELDHVVKALDKLS
jgi:hypothetical protein